jgi:hypothetical protein
MMAGAQSLRKQDPHFSQGYQLLSLEKGAHYAS